jgi:hypothetical protein
MPKRAHPDHQSRRVERLAKGSQRLDDMMRKSAEMYKRIDEDLRRLHATDKLKLQRVTKAPRVPRRAK